MVNPKLICMNLPESTQGHNLTQPNTRVELIPNTFVIPNGYMYMYSTCISLTFG